MSGVSLFIFGTTIGNFAALFRHKRVLSYTYAGGGFSFCRYVLFLSKGRLFISKLIMFRRRIFGYYRVEHRITSVCDDDFINSRFVRRVGALNMFRAGLIQF
ncbi:hypothetical protein KCP71_15545 [Salmonella enterica subsp. enterica]|nr:hypothetical protein KCP71_15545 [Salmonella enterica subsp. enterica]